MATSVIKTGPIVKSYQLAATGGATIAAGAASSFLEIDSSISGKIPVAARLTNYNTPDMNDRVILTITQWYSHTYVTGFNPRAGVTATIPDGTNIYVLYV